MRFWFVHSGEVSLREQIITQIVLAIGSGDLKPGERLPSTRAMAMRYGIHANTVSAAYQQLEQLGRVASRKGSGVYVASTNDAVITPAALSGEHSLQREMRSFLRAIRSAGFTDDGAIRRALDKAIAASHSAAVTFIEPDPALANIVLREMAAGGANNVLWLRPEDISTNRKPLGRVVTLPSKLQQVRELLPAHDVAALTINSVPQSLLAYGDIPPDALIGIASHWTPFLHIAQTMLLARGISADAVVLRDANEPGWQHGLEACAAVICDVVAASALPRTARTIPFQLIAPEFISALR